MIAKLLILGLIFLTSETHAASCDPGRDDPRGSVGDFDLWQLALSWAPEFCNGRTNKNQCKSLGGSWGARHLTIHGLWPGYVSGRTGGNWPQHCSCGDDFCLQPNVNTWPPALRSDLEKYGPGYVLDTLASHEWCKHGTCAGYTNGPNDFYLAAIETLRRLPGEGTPPILTSNVGKDVSQTELRNQFKTRVALSCSTQCSLDEIIICFAAPNPPLVGAQIDCPAWNFKGGSDDCRNCDQIKIRKAPNDDTPWVDTPVDTPPVDTPPVDTPVDDDEPAGGTRPPVVVEPIDPKNCPTPSETAQGSVGKFDLWQLGLDWTPQYCEKNKNSQRCKTLSSWGAKHFTVQGLRPMYKSKKANVGLQYAQRCACSGEDCKVQPTDWSSTWSDRFQLYAPGYVTDKSCLAYHQWTVYGTCSGLGPDEYLQTSVHALFSIDINHELEGTPATIFDNIGRTVTKNRLKTAFPYKTGLVCDKCILSQAFPCFRKTAVGLGPQTDCPDWVLAESSLNSCFLNSCNSITIPSWSGASWSEPLHDEL